MNSKEEVTSSELKDLLHYFAKNTYKARDTDPKIEATQKRCLNLFGKDYRYSIVSNANGELCGHYPLKIVILESCIGRTEAENDRPQVNNATKLRELFTKARFARCRSRFVIPVILFEGKNICRSATLSGAAEIYGRSGYDFLFAGGGSLPVDDLSELSPSENTKKPHPATAPYSSGEWALFDRIRGQDIRLLKSLDVHYICDLMVEKKKVKFGMRVTSSEKVDKENRYSDFTLCSVPYPGCEFFKRIKENGYTAEGLYFDWEQDYVDAQLTVPDGLPVLHHLGIDWWQYQSWDLISLTQNYLSLLLECVKQGEGGLLVHCISGWDRTPLFVSLIRMSLWADGKIHNSLSALEVLFLTIAYDWFSFGHDLSDRLQKGEEVFYFCFNFLKYISSDEFSVNRKRSWSVSSGHGVRRSDSVGQFDGTVLLDDRHSRGSNTSINSCCSLNCEPHRLSYFIGQEIAEDNESLHSSRGSLTNGFSNQNGVRYTSHMTSPRLCPYANGHEDTRHHETTETSPLPVPRLSRKNSISSDPKSSCSSSICGSWQIISAAGSPKGTTTIRDSPLATDHSGSNSSLSECDEMSSRQRRLDAVRMLFLKTYATVVGFDHPETGGLSSIFDHVTDLFEGLGTVV